MIKKEIRNMIIFAQQNIISDPPFTKLDILCCRNLLIYLNAKLQQRLIPLFHYALNRDGVLLLGSADTPGHFSELFVAPDDHRPGCTAASTIWRASACRRISRPKCRPRPPPHPATREKSA